MSEGKIMFWPHFKKWIINPMRWHQYPKLDPEKHRQRAAMALVMFCDCSVCGKEKRIILDPKVQKMAEEEWKP